MTPDEVIHFVEDWFKVIVVVGISISLLIFWFKAIRDFL